MNTDRRSKPAAWQRWQSLAGDLSHAMALERYGPRLAPRVLWRVPTGERVIALSFDDGPHPRFTPAVLDVLAEFGVHATFFLVGNHVREFPALVQRLAEAGHELGNHTLNHRLLPLLSEATLRYELLETGAQIRALTGRRPQLVRPPMGLFTRRVLDVCQACGYRVVVGDVYPRDPDMPGRDKICRRVMHRAQPGSIVILHDGGNTFRLDRSQTVQALQQIIPRLRDQGYRFLTISGMAALSPSVVAR